jgi:hypothetical protein
MLRAAFKAIASVLTMFRRRTRLAGQAQAASLQSLATAAMDRIARIEFVSAARMMARPPLPTAVFAPMRPQPRGCMCEAQRVDLAAAQAGKITWAQYFAMWGAVLGASVPDEPRPPGKRRTGSSHT